ncbi:transforming growth factor-beta-induced protein ig-h3-like [Pomacea canaliculata]|nr:transforming growth factor-beta-induced protein ig-h3-like [Pomacea canaliculata]XP_025085247.1 transforming growth factor-beta-induced protein ig-h3-like [Pomacea canaliculata]
MMVAIPLLVVCSLVFVSASAQRANGKTTKSPGPNMCMVQQVIGTNEKFFTHCVAQHLKMICERPTFLSWDCCSGYEKEEGKVGCTKVKPLGNLLETAGDLGLSQFSQHAERNNLSHTLRHEGAFTVFAPANEAFAQTTPYERSLLNPAHGSQSLLLYHVAPGKLTLDTFHARSQNFVTLYEDKRIRVNKYAYGVATVNCARIIRADETATNGIIHVIDEVVKPLDLQGNLAERIFSDDKYSQFQLALFVADMINQLHQTDRTFTVLAPTDQAFAKLPREILDLILTDANTAEKVIKRHVVRGVYCGDAIVVSVGLKTLDDSRVLFRCTRNGLYVNGARVVDRDLLATNGVIHGIDRVLLPDSVRQPTDLLDEMNVKQFMALVRRAGLEHKLNNVSNVTIFAPTDKALDELPSSAQAALTSDPLAVDKLLDYHIVKGRLTENRLIGDLALDTGLSAKIKVTVFRNGVAVNNAKAVGPPRECDKALIQKVDKVLVPTENTLMDLINNDKDLSIFQQAMETSGMSETLLRDGSYTVLAPTNMAFSYLNQWRLDEMLNDPERVKKFVDRHIINRMIVKCEIPEQGTYGIASRQGDLTVFTYDTRNQLLVNDLINVDSPDNMAVNGVLHKVADVLKCSCELGVTMSTRYQHRTSSRRHFHRLRY